MSFLNQMDPDDRDMVVSLPYRVGLRVSKSDDTGGNESDEQEMQALSSILSGYAQEVFGSETVQYIISETISKRNKWPEWSGTLEKVEDDCHKAIDVLSSVVDQKEVNAFKQHLIEIGESVAMAFREQQNLGMIAKLKLFMDYKKDKKLAAQKKISVKTWDQFLNISAHERRALRSIAGALNITYI
ncbi:MAG: hypothetical protein IPH06_02210 [Alphaproteobacteria bacterium]|jgi:hypothetical protein|nr:hypothetical protein [Alphaproteobacteria bacterium]QQS56864.1 MAG: hypothetical protein IPN28_11465 [Alphaproteobacteria bacterium]